MPAFDSGSFDTDVSSGTGGGGSCPSGVCGTGGWTGPKPGDPSNNSILSAVGTFGGIEVSWNLPTTNPYAVSYVKLYRGTDATFSNAVLFREVAGSEYFDRLDNTTRYYYWIQIVSVNGTIGEPIGPASAIAKPAISEVIEQLTNQIDAGKLATSLKTQLDQISIINGNLLQEIMDRETGQTSLADAIADAQAGIAQAHTFIINETASRTSQNEALVEQLNGVVATLGDDYAAVIETMQAGIDSLNGTVSAMYTVKVNVNGLVGGFGLINDGDTVEAGFDVDRFWIGRTSADKRKPFIIDGGVVYIDEAAINKLTFSKLRDETGGFVVQDGKVKADYISGKGLNITDMAGNVLLNAGSSTFAGNVTGSVGGTAVGTLNTSISTALVNASTAQANATTALNKLADIAEDDLLTPGEKPSVVAERDAIVAEQPGISAVAANYSLNSEGTTYVNAYNALISYLGTLTTPVAWNNYSGNTSILRTTFTSKFNDYYTTRQALLNAVTASAKSRADAAQATATSAQNGLATRLRNDAQNVLSGPGGLATGNLTWDSAGNRTGGYGVGFSQKGIVAYNSIGNATFVLDGTTGSASFAGSLNAASGSFAGTLTATAINAVDTINIAGGAVSANVSVTGTAATISTTVTVPAGETYRITGIGFQVGTHPDSGGSTPPGVSTLTIARGAGSFTTSVPNVVVKVIDGETVQLFWGYSAATLAGMDILPAGSHTVSLTGTAGLSKTLLILISKR